jgi:hypothetical protein
MDRAMIRYFILLAWLASPALSETHRVPDEYATIQAAIDASLDGDLVLVAPGTYSGDGNRDIDFGGKAIAVRSVDPNDPNIVSATVIDSQGSEQEPHRGFHFHSGEDANSIVQGFTITNGYVVDYDGGGGICCDASSPRILDCIVTGNTARWGGGIECFDSNSVIANCVVYDNRASSWGGGIGIGGEHPMVINCVVTGNWAGDYGGGVVSGGYPVFLNCTICGNSTSESGHGGGLTFGGRHGHKTILRNCILWGNTAKRCQQISCEFLGILGAPRIELVHCIVQNGARAICSICPVEGNWTSTEPHFANPGYWAPYEPNSASAHVIDLFLWVQGDYHLKSQAGRWDPNGQTWVQDDVTSPCIDAGDPSTPIGNEPFPNGGIVNIGAYGGTAEASKSYFGKPVCETIVAGDINGDCKVDSVDFAIMAFHWLEKK